MKEDKLISETISLLRFPLTVFVVFIHYNMGVRGFSLHSVTYGLDAPEWFRWVTAFFSDVLPRTAVPLFYIISGYLFFRGDRSIPISIAANCAPAQARSSSPICCGM